MLSFERALDGGEWHYGFARARFVFGLEAFVRLCELYCITCIVLLWDSLFNCLSARCTQGAMSTVADEYTTWIRLSPTTRVLTLNKSTHTARNLPFLSKTAVNGSRSLPKGAFSALIIYSALWRSCGRTRCTIKSIDARTSASEASWLLNRLRTLKFVSFEASRRVKNVLSLIMAYLFCHLFT